MTDQELRAQLPQSAVAPREARQLIRNQLQTWSLDAVVDDVLLLASEVVTNAVHHGRPQIELGLALGEGTVRVEVRDEAPGHPVRQAMSNDALRGRGIGIVASLATRWGVDPIPGDGKTVWFEVAV